MIAAVERKSLPDLVASLIDGTLRFALGDLAALPHAAVVVEDRYSQLFKLDRVRPAMIADGLAELAVRWPNVPVMFCESRQLAEEWTYRYLAAAYTWAGTELAMAERIPTLAAGLSGIEPQAATGVPEPSTSEVREWARSVGLAVPPRGRLRPEIWHAWHEAHEPQAHGPGGPHRH